MPDPLSTYLLVGALMLGALGLFLAMPGGYTGMRRLGQLLLAAAGGSLVALLARYTFPTGTLAPFLICTLVALFGALRVITHPKPVYSALYFVLLIVAVTGLIVLMDATFVAAVLLIVYAGAILVTYVFVIMLAQQGRPAPYDARTRAPFWGGLAGFALLTVLTSYISVPPTRGLADGENGAAAQLRLDDAPSGDTADRSGTNAAADAAVVIGRRYSRSM